jgi:hypothetical protein
MKRTTILWLILATVLLCAGASPVCAQQPIPHVRFKALPAQGDSVATMAAAAGATSANSIPMWTYTTLASRDGNTYHGTMVGRSPFFHGARTTEINTILIPVKISITTADGTTVFDPTQPDPTCLPNGTATAVSLTQQSPILMPANFTMNGVDEGSTQYIDAFQRANFDSVVSQTGDRYHTLLNLTKTLPPISVSMNAPNGATTDGFCGKIGVVDINVFNTSKVPSLLTNLASQGVGPTTVPVFLLYNIVMTEGSPDQKDPFNGNCCILGYHSLSTSGSKVQLVSVADYDSSGVFSAVGAGLDVSVLSHEIGELFDDPLVQSPSNGGAPGTGTPLWGNVGQVQGACQDDLEVGDPLSGNFFPSVTMPNGVTYTLQELAFYSWFFGGPSIGAGGLFSNNGTFTDQAQLCQ